MQPPLEAKATLERAPIMDKKVQELWAVEQQFKQLTEIRNLQVGHMAMADNDKSKSSQRLETYNVSWSTCKCSRT
jgi:hypothetical protein